MNSSHDLAVITSRLRVEEKLIFTALERCGVEFQRVDDGAIQLNASQPGSPPWPFVWNRSLSYGRTLATTQILESRGVRCFNAARTIEICGDKVATSAALTAAGIATPRTLVAFTEASALEACEELGYPCVIKPVVGSWGRLVARLDGRSAAEAVLEDRAVLGSWQHSVFYLQEYVEKPGRDARAFVIGDECVAAIWRTSEHWITNTARGARTEKASADGELGALAVEAARAVGGGMLAVDIVEGPDGPLVLEVNHSMEFRNSIEPTGVDIPGAMAGWVAGQMQAAAAACAEVHP